MVDLAGVVFKTTQIQSLWPYRDAYLFFLRKNRVISFDIGHSRKVKGLEKTKTSSSPASGTDNAVGETLLHEKCKAVIGPKQVTVAPTDPSRANSVFLQVLISGQYLAVLLCTGCKVSLISSYGQDLQCTVFALADCPRL